MKRGTGRPTAGYFSTEGTRVPSVTAILSYGGHSGGLVGGAMKNWHEAGRLGLPFDRNAYWGSRELWGTDAKEIGSIVHQWIEDDIHGEPRTRFDDLAGLVGATTGYQAYCEWRDGVKLEIVETEVPLVSEDYGYGGTIDALAEKSDGTRVLVDWKTSNSTRGSYIAQLAAYRQLLVERDGFLAPRSAFLLRVGKTHGDFHFHSWPKQVLDEWFPWFLGAKTIYDIETKFKSVAS